jgi:Pyruvate/2-oxoacid:ferredoxin oxidoreductase delta subunit
MGKDVYERLADHLDSLPAGFPKTPEGIELRILKRLFSEEEAELACQLTMMPEDSEAVADRVGQPVDIMASKLSEMANKGLIFRMERDGIAKYSAAQFVVGIWEYQLKDLDEALVRDMEAYFPYLSEEIFHRAKTQQLRTIPIAKSLSGEGAVMPYEEARKILDQQSKIVLAECICRKERKMVDEGCEKPMENCFSFGTGAYFYEANGLGREISKAEAFKIIDEAEKACLVLQPTNSQKVAGMCLCCGCCCGMLRMLKLQDKPARHVQSNFYALVDADRCIGCEICLDRCQMDAIEMIDDVARVDLDRCIGCGLCVPTCSAEALSMAAKPEQERYTPPATMAETFMRIADERGRT